MRIYPSGEPALLPPLIPEPNNTILDDSNPIVYDSNTIILVVQILILHINTLNRRFLYNI
jgi:hypothetical protein